MAEATQWQNRITGHADVDPAQLLGNPKNYRRHPGPQQDALSGVIGQIGYLDPVLVQKDTDVVIDGHLRVELALRSGQPTIPVTYVDLTDEEAALALATFDPISALAYHDAEQLDALLREVSTDDAAVLALLDSLSSDVPEFDPTEHWKGMPEFEQEDREACQQIVVNFATPDDVQDFARLIRQPLTSDTDSIWHPAQRPVKVADRYVADIDDAA